MNKTPTLVNEAVPEPRLLHSVWKFCRPRQEVEISFMGFAGVRPEVLGGYRARDGLRLADLPDIHYINDLHKVSFEVTEKNRSPKVSLGSWRSWLSSAPVIEKQILNPAQEYWVLPKKASIVHPPSNQPKAYDSLFFSEGEHCWNVRESPIFEVL